MKQNMFFDEQNFLGVSNDYSCLYNSDQNTENIKHNLIFSQTLRV